MDRGSLLPFQLWCPRPFGTYSQNQPRPPSAALKPPACADAGGGAEPDHAHARSENTPPASAAEAPAAQHAPLLSSAAAGDEGRVLLDTWYVIKPGNTKEKVAFFVAHQCGGGSRANSMKVKGHWGSESSKAKRRRRCLEPTKAPPDPGGRGGARATEGPPTTPGEDVDLLSVAEMVALVEQRAALALQSYPRPAAQAPVVFVSAEQGAPAKGLGSERRSAGGDCSRVAEAVAHFEAQRDSPPTKGLRKEERPGPGPGEVRIAFRISNGREPRSPDGNLPTWSGSRPGSPGPGARAKDKITCDLYQLISPSRDALPSNMEFLLARADEASEGETPAAARPEDAPPAPPPPPARDCGASGFHVDVVVTGVVDECIFFGKDGTKNVKEETVCLTVSPEEPPPPGQLFFLPARGPEGPPEPPPADTPSAVPGPDDPEGAMDTSCAACTATCHTTSWRFASRSSAFWSRGSTCCCCLSTCWSRSSASCPPEPWQPSSAPAATSRTSSRPSGCAPRTPAGTGTRSTGTTPVSSAARGMRRATCRCAAGTPSPTTMTCLTDAPTGCAAGEPTARPRAAAWACTTTTGCRRAARWAGPVPAAKKGGEAWGREDTTTPDPFPPGWELGTGTESPANTSQSIQH